MITGDSWVAVHTAMRVVAWITMGAFLLFLGFLALPRFSSRTAILRVVSNVTVVIAVMMIVYVISPLDLIPDGNPAVEKLGDLMALFVGLTSGTMSQLSENEVRKARTVMTCRSTLDDDDI